MMNRPCKELKRIARDNLNGNYKIPMGAFLIATLIPLAVELPFSMLQHENQPLYMTLMFYVAELLIALLSIVLSVGVLQTHLSIARKKEVKLQMVFCGFQNNADRYILTGLLLILAGVACCLPLIVGAVLSAVIEWTWLAVCAFIVLGIAGIVCAVIVEIRYALALYLLLDHAEMGAREALKCSGQIMKGNKGRLFYIYLSFIGLQILCLLSLGIGSLWVCPYQSQTLVNFYLDVIGELPPNLS